MSEPSSGFDWDAGNWQKCQKHGVSIAEIEAVFGNNPMIAPDIRHSNTEIRFLAIGRNTAGRLIFTIFTKRKRGDEILIRPVSARYMREKELRRYAKTIA